MSENRIRDAWALLAAKMNDDGALDENTMASLRYCFIAGAATMQGLLFKSIDESTDPDDPTDVADMNELVSELEELMDELAEEESDGRSELATPVDGTAVQETAVEEGRTLPASSRPRRR